MQVILLQDVKSIGKKGDLIKTKEGYAKNFLFPKKLAVEATTAELNKLNAAKTKIIKNENKIIEEAQAISDKMKEKELLLKVKTGKDGKTFGSVSSKDVSEAIKTQFNLDIDKRKISLDPEHIKQIGTYEAKIKLHSKVHSVVKVKVEGL